jgi:hypothetical protein
MPAPTAGLASLAQGSRLSLPGGGTNGTVEDDSPERKNAPRGLSSPGMSRRHIYPGACHCRNIEVRLESDKTPLELGLRTDSCSFCDKHHALYTSDPDGELHIAIGDDDRVARYRFGTKTADFLLCTTCGVFVAASMSTPPVAAVNVNVLDARAAFLDNHLQVADFSAESLDRRLARRSARWTPVFLRTRTGSE